MEKMTVQQTIGLAKEVVFGKVSGNYSLDQANTTLYNALIDANNGKKYLDIRDIRDGKCSALFEIIEEVIKIKKHDMISHDPFFMRFVDYRNYDFGDKPEFVVPNKELFVVSEIGGGSQAIRRQRLIGTETFSVNTTWKAIKIYEEIELVLAGRVDFSEMIELVAKSFYARDIEDIFKVWTGAIAGLEEPYMKTGSFTESQMIELIQHVKAANGSREAYITGTLLALNKVVAPFETASQAALDSRYYNGFAGMFNGTPKMEIMQMHKPGTNEFALPDDVVTVMAGDIKPIMYVTEGTPLILPRNFTENVDLSQEYMMMEKTGVAARVAAGEGMFGRYKITG